MQSRRDKIFSHKTLFLNCAGVIALWILLLGTAVIAPQVNLYNGSSSSAYALQAGNEHKQQNDESTDNTNSGTTDSSHQSTRQQRDETAEPLAVQIASNATEGVSPATFELRADVTGGREPYTFNWNFGDDTKESDRRALLHTFETAGTYNVTLTATDATGQTAVDTLIMDIQGAGGDDETGGTAATDNTNSGTTDSSSSDKGTTDNTNS